jgi:hypothetical protein
MSPSPAQPLSESQWSPECVICKKSVKLEESKADEYGQAIHGECYFAKITEKKPPLLSLGWRKLSGVQ